MDKKSKILIIVCTVLFLAAGVYLTFIVGNTSKYDSKTKAYRIYPNESRGTDNNTYNPIYYFKVDGKEYECHSKTGSSSYPDADKNVVYYDSKNPEKCLTEYEKSSGKLGGILCLVAAGIIIFLAIKKPEAINTPYNRKEIDYESQPVDEEQAEKMLGIVSKVQLIYKRVIIGIVIVILTVMILIDTAIVKQTIKAKDYIETTATYVDKKDSDDSIFDDAIYTFVDKNGNQQEVTISVSKGNTPESLMKIKYNENNPQEFYEETAVMNKSGIIWYIVKIVAVILLIILFCNKKLLSKINISASNRSN